MLCFQRYNFATKSRDVVVRLFE